ncbi:MAG: DUF2190 family protein [Candidatus Thiodiazotropha taylori]|nr:DUF2190 family protein [Candidatus Thiodiazotropha taylori]
MRNGVDKGKALTWNNTTGSDVISGQVVLVGATLAVAAVDIPHLSYGTVVTHYTFTLPKVSGAVIAQGESLMWDVSAGAFNSGSATPAAGDVTGGGARADESAASGATSLAVHLTGVPGTIN